MDEQHLWFSSFAGAPALTRLQWHTGQADTIALPVLEQDTVMYITNNPVRQQEGLLLPINVMCNISPDHGKTWQQIAKQGVTLS